MRPTLPGSSRCRNARTTLGQRRLPDPRPRQPHRTRPNRTRSPRPRCRPPNLARRRPPRWRPDGRYRSDRLRRLCRPRRPSRPPRYRRRPGFPSLSPIPSSTAYSMRPPCVPAFDVPALPAVPVVPDGPSSASAMPGLLAIAAPMPSATANAPTLPMKCPYVFGVVANAAVLPGNPRGGMLPRSVSPQSGDGKTAVCCRTQLPASITAIATKTAPIPVEPTTPPTTAGIATWPSRLPLSRTPTAVPRMSGGAVWAIQLKLSGCPMPNPNPATAMMANTIGTDPTNGSSARATAGRAVLITRSRPRPTIRVIGRRNNRDTNEAPAPADRSRPTVDAESPCA